MISVSMAQWHFTSVYPLPRSTLCPAGEVEGKLDGKVYPGYHEINAQGHENWATGTNNTLEWQEAGD